MKPSLQIVLHSLWLLACAIPGVLVAHAAIDALGLQGVWGALATVIAAMALTMLVFLLTVALGRAFRLIR